MTTRIAFLGTGLMGAPMALRLLSAGFAVTVWNRSPEKTAPATQSLVFE
jgi:2-hydroxy-3-oxopropionate reductase